MFFWRKRFKFQLSAIAENPKNICDLTQNFRRSTALTYGVSFEELHGALEEVGEHPLVHDGPGPRS
jgi:hypothetical protein